MKFSKQYIYLDSASATYLHPSVKAAMLPFFNKNFGNPSGLHQPALKAGRALHTAREQVARILNAKTEEIIFTAGGSESINLAIFGIARKFEILHKKKGHIITTPIEHSAVLNSVEALKEEGWQISYLPVNNEGLVNIQALGKVIQNDTILISIMLANNEIGTIQPITQIGKYLENLNTNRLNNKLPKIYFHTDACQAGGVLDLNVQKLKVDLMTLNGSKIYGPKQTSILYKKTNTPLRPIIFGGGQENNFRSGTENLAGIIGFATALKLAQQNRIKTNKRLRILRNYLINTIMRSISDCVLNGPAIETDSEHLATRLPNNANLSFKHIEGETLLLFLDAKGIGISTGSACHTQNPNPSHVLSAIKLPNEYIAGTARFTLSNLTTKTQLDYTVKTLQKIISTLRQNR